MASYIQPNKMLLWEHGKGAGSLLNLKRQCTFLSLAEHSLCEVCNFYAIYTELMIISK